MLIYIYLTNMSANSTEQCVTGEEYFAQLKSWLEEARLWHSAYTKSPYSYSNFTPLTSHNIPNQSTSPGTETTDDRKCFSVRPICY